MSPKKHDLVKIHRLAHGSWRSGGGTHFALPGEVQPAWRPEPACADPAHRQASHRVIRRGHPVGVPATSNDGGDIGADALTKYPVQVLCALRPARSVTAPFQSGLDVARLFAGAIRLVLRRSRFPTIGPIGGLAMPVTADTLCKPEKLAHPQSRVA
jgi:hypothetical protein